MSGGAFRSGAAIAAAFLLAGPAAGAEEQIGVDVHHAYGSSRQFTVEGRVVERREGREVRPGDSWLRNLWRTLRSLRVEEQTGTPLLLTFASRTWELRSDEEGYFVLRGGTPPRTSPGWHPLRVQVAGADARTDTALLLVPDGATLGVISDFDDTLVVSDVSDRSRLLSHALFENPLQRQAVPGMAAFFRAIARRNPAPDAAPLFYLTGSPRQLLPDIRLFLEHHGFPRGTVIARKVTDGGGGDPLLDQERYKLERIERILEELPATRFVLVGDDGERDPEVYRTVRERHPDRVAAVYIRRVSPDPFRPVYAGQLAPPPADAPPATVGPTAAPGGPGTDRP